ncbi:HD domain-containing protein [Acaryochloris sp. CCMEE 5410]|uniref:HD domain-containing protein n=1 Tax=Acaryochloris sp. CCMEE 5410 TaxID=310037 RepID=UPI0002FB6C59|nr:HD domain-containing protein [Acaryochloris sp. CCMEE 5410]KAI9131673.1 hypothetical protein ON05_029275 [Acaryochloris sp. CCMEE 5410]
MRPSKKSLIGSIDWGNIRGKLSPSERIEIFFPLIKTISLCVRDLAFYCLPVPPKSIGELEDIEINTLLFPDSQLAKEAEKECFERYQSNLIHEEIINHSFRTYLYSLALNHIDGLKIDRETLYVASLLHDIALESKSKKCCFAVESGDIALNISKKANMCNKGIEIANAISMHVTPDIKRYKDSFCTNSPIGNSIDIASIIADASLLDLAGYRLWQVNKKYWKRVDEINYIDKLSNHVVGCKDYNHAIATENDLSIKKSTRYVANCWRQRAANFPEGRAAYIEKNSLTLFSKFIYYNPIR